MDMNQYMQMFIEESQDNLQRLNENLLKLEKDPEDLGILNEIFRIAHTLKGMSGTMGFTKIQNLTHNAENVLSELRTGEIKVSTGLIDILFSSLDALENYVDEIVRTGIEGHEEYSHIIVSLNAILESKDSKKEDALIGQPEKAIVVAEDKDNSGDFVLPEAQQNVVREAQRQALNVYRISISLSPLCVLKSARAFIIFRELESIGEIIHAIPSVREIEDEKFDTDFEVVLITGDIEDAVKEILMNVVEVDKVEISSVAVPEEKVGNVGNTENVNNADQTNTPDHDDKESDSSQERIKPKAGKTVRVDIERLDSLMNLVSELIIVKTQLEGIGSSETEDVSYGESVEYLERVTTSLHDAVMKVRMVPVEIVFNRFPRMIRDVSRKLNKEIELVMSGEETELDRTVIDEIGDPLIHLLRNAADHGLETTEERLKLGKPRKGTVDLKAYQDGNNVVIEVNDDGAGIDVKKIRKAAITKGVISKEVAANMSDQEIIELLFAPSFTTSEEITDVSGRGVGLDVVKSKIAVLGGNIEVKTEMGKGSKFIVRLPLTLAIIQALMVQLGEEKYAIPLSNIQNIEDIKVSDIQYVQKQEIILLRNEVIPIIRLHKLLGVENQEEKETIMVVIVKKGDKQVGFVIDALIGQQEIVIKSLGKYLSGIKMIAGATILGNGEVALILDINTLI
ncbi:MAG TPA: chemotaxis protein CheA [Epulopiscium sp.]|nr:chemotaxis protein CheA [Candidatus Epulonipiscium sp.]